MDRIKLAEKGKSWPRFLMVVISAMVVFFGKVPVSEAEEMKVQITVVEIKLTATLNDTEVSRKFAEMLPLDLLLKDYSGTEKISHLPQKLPTDNEPSGYNPSVGDITYYAPWGNMAIFYKDFGYAGGLIHLGKIDDDGIKQLASLNKDFKATFELMK